MVRTPLAETTSNDLLNSTQISLPRFDHGQVNQVRDYLFSTGGGIDGGRITVLGYSLMPALTI